MPVSGKSTLAGDIADKLKFPVFSVDPIESAILKTGIKRSFETGLAAYLIAETLADAQLKLGISVIIDAVSLVKEAREMWQKLSRENHTRLIIIECILDPGLHKKRVESRVRKMHGIPEVTWKDVENRRKEYLKWKEERLIIDTANSPKNNLIKALEYINFAK